MKRSYLNFFAIAGLAAGVATFSSCNNDPCDDANCAAGQVCVDGDCIDLNNGNELVTTNISVNTTWTADKVYQLAGRITVVDGVMLQFPASPSHPEWSDRISENQLNSPGYWTHLSTLGP